LDCGEETKEEFRLEASTVLEAVLPILFASRKHFLCAKPRWFRTASQRGSRFRDAVMDIRIRRVRRSWVERLFLWERAYEAQTERDHERIVERAKTAEAAEALVFKRMTDNDIQIEVRGDLIIVTQPSTSFSRSTSGQQISRS
jgi:hypothetical protein